jgi:hypothetical protein
MMAAPSNPLAGSSITSCSYGFFSYNQAICIKCGSSTMLTKDSVQCLSTFINTNVLWGSTSAGRVLKCDTNCNITSLFKCGSDSKSCPKGCKTGFLSIYGTDVCFECDINCKTCEGEAGSCRSCNMDSAFRYLLRRDPISRCYATCPDYYYHNKVNATYYTCEPCTNPKC